MLALLTASNILFQILVELGGQVCFVWANGTGNEYKMPPENFNVYLNALLAFTRHDSQMVSHCHEISSSSTFGAVWVACSLTESAVLGSIPAIDLKLLYIDIST